MSPILYRASTALALSLSLALTAVAQESDPFTPDQLTGTLKKIKERGVITLGHRENSVPFAFLDPRRQPIGYSVELCNAIVEQVIDELGGLELRVDYRPVTPDNRFALLAGGEIDLECGSTTNNSTRRREAAFSPLIFVTGTKVLVRKGSPVKSVRDLRGKTIAVTRGTTNEAAMRAFSEKQKLGITFLPSEDHKASFQLLASGKADAFANDEVLLYGLLAETKASAEYRVVGELLSYEPLRACVPQGRSGVRSRSGANLPEACRKPRDRMDLRKVVLETVAVGSSPQPSHESASRGELPGSGIGGGVRPLMCRRVTAG